MFVLPMVAGAAGASAVLSSPHAASMMVAKASVMFLIIVVPPVSSDCLFPRRKVQPMIAKRHSAIFLRRIKSEMGAAIEARGRLIATGCKVMKLSFAAQLRLWGIYTHVREVQLFKIGVSKKKCYSRSNSSRRSFTSELTNSTTKFGSLPFFLTSTSSPSSVSDLKRSFGN